MSRAALRENFICSSGKAFTTADHTLAHSSSIHRLMCPCRSKLCQWLRRPVLVSSVTRVLAALVSALLSPSGLASRTSLASVAGQNVFLDRLCSRLRFLSARKCTHASLDVRSWVRETPALLTQEYPITWVERELDSLATRHIKRWAGLTK